MGTKRVSRLAGVAALSAGLTVGGLALVAEPAAAACGNNHYGSTYYGEYGGYSTTYYFNVCSSLEVTQVGQSDFYAGYYYSSSTGWRKGSRGNVFIQAGFNSIILLSGVAAGTAEKVWSPNQRTGISWWN